MFRRLPIGLLASVITLSPLAIDAEDVRAEDLGDVMRISPQDVGPGRLDRHLDAINSELIMSNNLSYEDAFDIRFSTKITWHFKTNSGLGGQDLSSQSSVEFLSISSSQRDGRTNHANSRLIGMAPPPPLPLLLPPPPVDE